MALSSHKVNDVLHGRQAAAELMRVALSEFSVAHASGSDMGVSEN